MFDHGSEGATALFDMDGFVVRAQMLEHGEWWLLVETTAAVVGCPSCGVRAVGHARRRVQVRDLPIAGRPVRLVWSKRIWRCPDEHCERRTWSETHDAVAPRASLTRRARVEVCRRVGEDGDSVAAVAADFGVGWHTAMGAVVEHGEPLVEDPDRLGAPSALGLDETSFLCAGPTHPRVMVTGFADLDRRLLLDVAEGRSGQVVRDWLDRRPVSWLECVGVAVVRSVPRVRECGRGPVAGRDDRRGSLPCDPLGERGGR